MNFCTPKEIVANSLQTWVGKSQLTLLNTLALGILAGAYIAFGAEGSTMATHDLSGIGLGRFLAGVIFATGLMLVVICGAELFTGNVLIWVGVLERKIPVSAMLRNWFWVYVGNFIGSLLIVYLMHASGLWSFDNNLYGAAALKIAVSKVNLSFSEAFVRGILCNWLVCLAVWMTFASKDVIGKIFGIFFPIMLFVTSNFEHCIANMYYLPAGLMAKTLPAVVEASKLGAKVDTLTIQSLFANNLLPVTLGNIVGGVFFVGTYYWFCYLRSSQNATAAATETESSAPSLAPTLAPTLAHAIEKN